MKQFMEDVGFWTLIVIYILISIIPCLLSVVIRTLLVLLMYADRIMGRIIYRTSVFVNGIIGTDEDEDEDYEDFLNSFHAMVEVVYKNV